MLAVGCKHTVIARQVDAGSGYQCREFGHEVQGFEDDVGGAVSVRCLELVTYVATRGERQPFFRHGGPGNVSAQSFQLVALMSLGRHACMQTDKIVRNDFEQPKAGPQGVGQDARSKPATLPTASPPGSSGSHAGRVCSVNTLRPACGPTAIR
ncbi:MAG: hypothetical protein ACI909_003582 [Planctomycetota bacterium]